MLFDKKSADACILSWYMRFLQSIEPSILPWICRNDMTIIRRVDLQSKVNSNVSKFQNEMENRGFSRPQYLVSYTVSHIKACFGLL